MTIFYIKKLKSIFIIFDENKSIMKRIIVLLPLTILIFSQILFINQAQAQSIELIGDSYVYGNPAMPIASYIIVKNITSNSLDVRCQKNIIDTTSGTQNYFCWGTSCWPSTTYISPDPAGIRTIPAGHADSSNFTGYYDAAFSGLPSSARAIVEYCFYPLGNISDSTCLTVHFNDNITSIEETQPQIGLNEFYPNPSVNKTSIKYIAERDSQLDIIDILGNKVKSFDLDNSGLLDISTSDLSSGIYFGNLVVHKRVVAVKKLIIN